MFLLDYACTELESYITKYQCSESSRRHRNARSANWLLVVGL